MIKEPDLHCHRKVSNTGDMSSILHYGSNRAFSIQETNLQCTTEISIKGQRSPVIEVLIVEKGDKYRRNVSNAKYSSPIADICFQL